MTHTITITLSESAQRAAILAGEPAQIRQYYEVAQEQLPRLLALPWASVDMDGTVKCVLPNDLTIAETVLKAEPRSPIDLSIWGSYASRPMSFDRRPRDAADAIAGAEAALAAVYDWIETQRVEHQAKAQERERTARASAAEWAALPLAWRASTDGVGTCGPTPRSAPEEYRGPLGISGYEWYSRDDLKAHAPEAWAEAEREVERLRAEAKRVRQEQRRAIVVGQGTEEQLERFDAGVLPNDEFVALAEQQLFAPFEGLAAYVPLVESDLDHVEDCQGDPEDDVRFGSSEADRSEWDADEWAGIKRVRAVAEPVSGATSQVREHRAHCRQCQAELYRYGVRVSIEYAGERYDREFAI